MSRVKAERAKAMLAERHAADTEPDPVVTAAEWLAARRAADTDEDPHREIGAADLAPEGEEATRSMEDRAADRELARGDTVEAEGTDLREIAAGEPAQAEQDVVRVPSADDVAGGCTQPDWAVAEIRARTADDDHLDEQDRADQLTHWHHQDHANGEVDTDEVDDAANLDDGDVLIGSRRLPGGSLALQCYRAAGAARW